jgi:RimJ/RimL family protein N-acetyltransferase
MSRGSAFFDNGLKRDVSGLDDIQTLRINDNNGSRKEDNPGTRIPHDRGRQVIMNLHFRDVTNDDLPLIEQWLQADHVRSTWGDPDANLRLLSEPPIHGAWRAIIEADGREVGIVLWQHPTRDELDMAGLTDIPTSVIDIDIMIGEHDALGSGLGSSAVQLVAEAVLSDPAVPFVMACARLDNLASQRAFAKAGFGVDREFDDLPNGRYVLMVRHRAEDQNP